MEDRLNCQISPFVKYRQNQNQISWYKLPYIVIVVGALQSTSYASLSLHCETKVSQWQLIHYSHCFIPIYRETMRSVHEWVVEDVIAQCNNL